MTGYARAGGAVPGVSFVVEVKSVNARGLDIRMRLAPGYDFLEGDIRRRLNKAITRGAVTLTLNVEREGEGGNVVVNEQALGAVLATLQRRSGDIDAERPSLDGILALKGVLEQHETPLSSEAEEELQAAILAAVDSAISDLLETRRREGAQLTAVVLPRARALAAVDQAAGPA